MDSNKSSAQPPQNHPQPSKTNGLAVTGFVLAFLLPIIGLILSIVGLTKAKDYNGNGHGLSIAGIVISVLLLPISFLITIGIIAGVGGAANSSQSSHPAAADKQTIVHSQSAKKAPSQPAPAPTPQILLDLSGSGTKQTQQFTAAGNWDLNWSYDCSNFGTQGNFGVTVYNKDGTPNFDNTPVNQLGASGSDVQHYYKGGTFYLDIESECSWTVTAKG